MKCDELQYERLGDANKTYPASTLVIRKQFVDAAIEELKDIAENACLECDDNQTAIDELEDENRKLKRALWMARAEKAHVTTLYWNVYCYQNNCLYFRDFMPENCNPFRSLPKKTAMEWSDLWESIEKKGMTAIFRIMEVAGVDHWNKLKGSPVRAILKDQRIYAIAHFLEDKVMDYRLAPFQEKTSL